MAEKKKGRSTAPIARRRKAPTRRAPDTGPLTLAEARAQIAAAAPRRAPRRAALAPTSVATVAAERRRLDLQRIDERAERREEYRAVLALLRQRGVRGLEPTEAAEPARRGRPAARRAPKAPVAEPLRIFAEGDSWFDYPVPLFGGGIVPRLERKIGVPILNLAKAGDEVRFMLGVAERKLLASELARGCPGAGPWDVLLFSGGGNDIVGNPMALWIRDFSPGASPAAQIHGERFATALAMVRAGYEDLIALRDALSPATRLVFHAYDFALADGRGICHLGPWLKPTFDLRKFPAGAGTPVVREMLTEFARLLSDLEASHPGVTFLDAQGTLSPEKSSWHNELHPSKRGFDTFAGIFQAKLRELFPGRVL